MGVKLAQSKVTFQKSQIYLTKMGVARAWLRSETNNFYLNYYSIKQVVQIVLILFNLV